MEGVLCACIWKSVGRMVTDLVSRYHFDVFGLNRASRLLGGTWCVAQGKGVDAKGVVVVCIANSPIKIFIPIINYPGLLLNILDPSLSLSTPLVCLPSSPWGLYARQVSPFTHTLCMGVAYVTTERWDSPCPPPLTRQPRSRASLPDCSKVSHLFKAFCFVSTSSQIASVASIACRKDGLASKRLDNAFKHRM